MPREAEWTSPLQAWQRKLFQVAVLITVSMIIAGIGGILVITDEKKTGWLTNTAFGRMWEDFGDLNLFFVPFSVVGGMLGTLLSLHNLQQDSIVRSKLAGGAPASAPAKAAAPKRRAKKVD